MACLFLAAGACGAAFVVAYILTSSNAVLGGLLAAAFLFLGAALILVGRFIAPQETVIEARARTHDPEQERAVAQLVRSAGGGARRRLLATAGAAAGEGIAAGAVTAAASLGPVDRRRGGDVPVPGRDELVDERGRPGAGLRPRGGLVPYRVCGRREPRGARLVGHARADPRQLHLPADRRGWAPSGIVAYSKICTHAGRAVAYGVTARVVTRGDAGEFTAGPALLANPSWTPEAVLVEGPDAAQPSVLDEVWASGRRSAFAAAMTRRREWRWSYPQWRWPSRWSRRLPHGSRTGRRR